MKTYVITGSIGHISKEIVKGLVKAGKVVRVITSSQDRVKEIEGLGAKAFVGHVQDLAFITQAFQGADVVYTMIPPIWNTTNWRQSQLEVAKVYAKAIETNGVSYVVNLSSLGAHLDKGNGPIGGAHDLEQLLNANSTLNVKHLRPGFFYYNLLNQIGLAKQAGILGANYGDGQKLLLVDPKDIAAVALEELLGLSFTGNSVRYVVGDARTGQEIAEVLGNAIGKPLNWVLFTDEQQLQGALQAGLSQTHAAGFTEMGKGFRDGLLQEEVLKNMPPLSPTKLEDFAKDFAKAYQASEAKVVA
jgi:uncharacterized protein YbjT (DUF2867 family)